MKSIITSFFFLAFLISSYAQNIYVNQAAVGANNGSSWLEAYTDLNDALNAAIANDTIRIAQGNYQPDEPDGNPGSTFWIEQDVVLLGGYNGSGATPDDRDPATYETILSGDLNGDDVDDNFDDYKSDNVMTVVTVAANVSNASLIDGFTIRGGYADGASTGSSKDGGAMYCSGDLLIKQCVFEQNYARERGGAILLNTGSNTVLENCTLKNNLANTGGALRITNASYLIKNCSFLENSLYDGVLEISGGAIFIQHSDGLIQDCLFKDNTALEYGGAMLVWSPTGTSGTAMEMVGCEFENNFAGQSSGGLGFATWGSNTNFTVRDCDFTNNESMAGGGGLAYAASGSANNSNINISNCEFSENSSVYHGGGIRFGSEIQSSDISITVDSCAFIENTNQMWTGGGFRAIILGENTEVTLTNSVFTGNFSDLAGAGAAIYGFDVNASGEVLLDNNVFQNNEGNYDAGLSIGSGTDADFIEYTITNCDFLNNHAFIDAGGLGLYAERPANFLVENCLLQANTADFIGGGVLLAVSDPDVEMEVQNCTFKENTSPLGAAIGSNPYTEDPNDFEPTTAANILFNNCLISGNLGEKGAIGLTLTGTVNLLNCTVANNPAGGISLDTFSTISLQNTILHNPGGLEYETEGGESILTSHGGNLFSDNSFASFALPSDQESVDDPAFESTTDFHLQDSSPAIDKGVVSDNLSEFDLDGNPRRFEGGCVDIGAYESMTTVSTECITNTREVLAAGLLTIYPNPATDFVTIALPENFQENFAASIFDAQGKLVSTPSISYEGNINVQMLAAGVYSLKIVNEQKVFIGRFIKS